MLVACLAALLLGFAVGLIAGRRSAPPPPRLTFYGNHETGAELRRRLSRLK